MAKRPPLQPHNDTGKDDVASPAGAAGPGSGARDDLAARFADAQVRVKQLPRAPGVDELLELYALYKQATVGDAPADRPGGFDFKAAAKHDAWARHRGSAAPAAMTAYVDLVTTLVAKYR